MKRNRWLSYKWVGRHITYFICFFMGIFIFSEPVFSVPYFYPWLDNYRESESILHRIKVPDGYKRVNVNPSTFEDWLRHLPLKKGKPPVYLFNGIKKRNQDAHFAVIDMDVGNKDLQQCADDVIRLRAEYFYSTGRFDSIHFRFTSGDNAEFRKWIEGYRPLIRGANVKWIKSMVEDSSYVNFRRYLNVVFTYAGSYSLSKELKSVNEIKDMRIGDVFIKGGFPGHSVIVVDMAVHRKTGKKLFLLAQSYTPAQDMHILKNPMNSKLSPWYELDFGDVLYTPEWIFRKDDLKRF